MKQTKKYIFLQVNKLKILGHFIISYSKMKDDFVKDILNTRYYSILTDGSTNASILEQQVLCILFLSSRGVPVLKFLSVDTAQHAHADGLKQCIKDSFQCIGITPLSSRLASINVDGAAVNTGLHSRLGVKFKETVPWISVIHCFYHHLELAVKDTFDGTFFRYQYNAGQTVLPLQKKSKTTQGT